MTYRYHGNYCGPGWSDGKYQNSVVGLLEPVDEFDATCKEHDAAYATTNDSSARTYADNLFVSQNFGKSLHRSVAAVAVAVNRIPRWFNPLGNNKYTTYYPKPHDLLQNNYQTQTMTKKSNNLRGSQPKGNQQTKNKSNGQTSYAPVARSRTVRIEQPKTTMKGGNTVVRHREYIKLVTSSTTQRIISVDVNPGMQACFNWLSTIARGYEKYKFHKLTFTYVSASSTTEKGRVALAFQYDPTARIPQTRTDYFNVAPNVEEAPWEDIVLHVQPPGGWLFSRSAGSTGTLNTYDAGKLLVMSALNANSTTGLGEIFVEYEVELARPQFVQPLDGKLISTNGNPAGMNGTDLTLTHGTLLFERIDGNTLGILAPCNVLITVRIEGTGCAMFLPVYNRTAGSTGYVFTVAQTPNAAGTFLIGVFELQECETGDSVHFDGGSSTTITSVTYRYAEYTSVA